MNINKSLQKKYLFIHIVSLFMILLLTGCSSLQVGRNFDVKAFESRAEVGKTSKAQVRVILGSPKSTGVSINKEGERSLEWIYFYATGKITGMNDAHLKILQIRFDQNEVVKSYNWSNSDK